MVQSSNPAGEKVRQLLEGAGRVGGVRGTWKVAIQQNQAPVPVSAPSAMPGQGCTVSLLLPEISFFFSGEKAVP